MAAFAILSMIIVVLIIFCAISFLAIVLVFKMSLGEDNVNENEIINNEKN